MSDEPVTELDTPVNFELTRPTGSSLERAEACPVSFSLPQITKASVFAEHGTAKHAYIRALLIGMVPAKALESVPLDLRDECRAIDIRQIVGELATVRSEVSYAIDVRARTVVELGVNIHRQYDRKALEVLGRPLGLYEVPLTIDVEGRARDGFEIAGDVKTGFKPIVAAAVHRQIHAEVTARALAAGADVVAGRIYKIRESGDVVVDPHLFEPLELDEIGDELLEIQEGVIRARKRFQEREEFTMNPGPWCDHCNAAPVCPARVALARAVIEQAGDIVARLATMTPEQEWQAWQQVATGRKLFEEIHDSLKAIAAQRFMMNEPISNPDGTEYVKPLEIAKSNFNRESALALLRHFGATEEQINKLWVPFRFEQFRVVKTKKPVKKRAKKAELPAGPDLELRRLPAPLEAEPKLKALPMGEDRSPEQLALDGDAARSPTSRMRDRANDK